jgi:hypothetical protein
MAMLSVLRPALQPIGTQSVGEFRRVRNNVRGIRNGDGSEEYSVRTR